VDEDVDVIMNMHERRERGDNGTRYKKSDKDREANEQTQQSGRW
jgi:hypothetical protein